MDNGRICPHCGAPLNDQQKFCTACGCPVLPSEPQPAPQAFEQPVQQPDFQPASQAFDQPAQQPDFQPAPQAFEQPAQQPDFQPAQQAGFQAAPQQPYYPAPSQMPRQPYPVAPAPKKKGVNPVVWIVIGVALLALILGLIFGIPAIQKAGKYKEATTLLNEGRYDDAMALFQELEDYSDSREMVQETKYQYAKANAKRDDKKTQEYLTELKSDGYKDAAKLYEDLFGWHVSLTYSNTDEDDTETIDDVISRHCEFYHFGFAVEGGKPGEKLDLLLETVYPDGETESDEFGEPFEDGGSDSFYYRSGLSGNDAGTMKLVFRNKNTNKEIATINVELVDEYIWKMSIQFFNTVKDDKTSFTDSVSKYTPYCHFGYKIWGGESDAELSFHIRDTFPDGSTEEYGVITKKNGSFSIYDDSLVPEPDVMQNGTMKREIVRDDTDEVLAAFSFEITDEKVAEPAFRGRIERLYLNTTKGDETTDLTSIPRSGSYLAFGYKAVSDNDATGTAKFRRCITLPDGTHKNDTLELELGSEYYTEWGNGYDFKEAGTVKIKYYDAVSNTLISEFSFITE